MKFLGAFLVAVMIFCGYLLFDQVLMNRKRRESLKLRIAPDGSTRSDYEEPLVTLESQPSPQVKAMGGLLRALGVNVDESMRKLERRFAQAGIASPDAPILYLFFQRVVSIVLIVIALMLLLNNATGMAWMASFLTGLFLAVIGAFGPYLWLQNKIDSRKKKLQRGFPDTLDLLLICVESGLALDAALNRVCNELGRAYPEMTAELNRTRLELALINDRVRALMNLGDRTDMVAFRSLVAALIQSERFGTSLTDTLRVLSEDFRLQRLSLAEAKAARLPVLLTIPLIFLLLPSFLLIVLGPAIVSFVHNGARLGGH
jgi:tight adherence protein C